MGGREEENHKVDHRAGTHLLRGQAEILVIVQPGKGFQYLNEAYIKAGEGIFIRTCSNRTRGNLSQCMESNAAVCKTRVGLPQQGKLTLS